MISFIGIASGLGAGNQGCAEGPLCLQANPHLLAVQHRWAEMFLPEKALHANDYNCLSELYTRVAKTTYELALADEFFVAFGGDHSAAIGTWSGVAEAKRNSGGIGLIWVDAHMDAHTPQTSESGNIHGMPLAALMGYGDKRLTEILSPHSKISPDRLSLIGVRSFESKEAEFLERLGVRIYFMDEVQERGLFEIFAEAILRAGPDYGLSIDLDSIDPSIVKAVGTPVKNGLCIEELIEALPAFHRHPPIALEVVEYNPSLDEDFSTAKIALQLIHTLCSPLFSRV